MEVKELIETREDPPLPEEVSPSAGEVETQEWRPQPSTAGRIGIGATAASLACAVAALAYPVSHPIAIESFVAAVAGLASLSLALFFGLATLGYRSLSYRLSQDTLTISWLWIREIVPLGRIEGVYRGHRLGKRAQVDGFVLPGHYVGKTRGEGLGRLRFYGTSEEPSAAMIVATATGGYAITPSDLQGFRDQLIQRLEAIPMEEIERAPEAQRLMPRLLTLSILRDSVAVAFLVLALMALLASFGYVSAKYPGLPELMPLHFNFAGEPDLIGPPRDAFRMPIIGLLILVANGVVAAAIHGWQRAAGRLLLVATVFMQLVMLIAVLRVVH